MCRTLALLNSPPTWPLVNPEQHRSEGTVGLAALREIAALVRAQGDLHRIAQRITVGYANPVSEAEKAISGLKAALDGIAAPPGTVLPPWQEPPQPGALRAS